MTIHDTDHTQVDLAEVVEETDAVTATIRHYMQQERAQADRYATDAAHHRQQAKRLEDQAMACRLRQQRWGRLLALEETETGDPINDWGHTQTALIPRPRRTHYPLVHPDGADTPHLACTGCGKTLRPATGAEVEAITSGREIKAVCDACQAKEAGSNGSNPYPPDAA